MLRQLRHQLLNLLLSAGYLGLLLVVIEARDTRIAIGSLALVMAAAFVAWLLAFRRHHAIVDTPTAHITTAAQGYVELIGQCDVLPGAAPLDFSAGPPCVWYRYRVYRGNKLIDSGQSHDTFLLRDESGECVIDPDLAEVTTRTTRRTRRHNYRTHADYLCPGEPLYAIGELRTLGGSGMRLDRYADIRELLREWKQEPADLRERFDANRDGQVDVTEWQVARHEAAAEVERRHAELRLHPDTHLLQAPADGRPYILSSIDPQRLARRYQWWTWAHAAAFVAASVWLLVTLRG